MNALRRGIDVAVHRGMKNTKLFTILLLLLLPAGSLAGEQKPDLQLSDCIVESIEFEGIDACEISEDLRAEARSLAGRKYNEKTVNDLADKLGKDLMHRYEISVHNTPVDGREPMRVKIVFRADRHHQKPEAPHSDTEVNINERYIVENVGFKGIDESRIRTDLREEAQSFEKQKYNAGAAHEYANKLSAELRGRSSVLWVEVKVDKGTEPDRIKLTFEAHKEKSVDFDVPFLLYHSKQGISGALEMKISRYPAGFTFGILTDAERLLERNAGFYTSFEHKSLGTHRLGFRIDFESYHQSFNNATMTALQQRPDVPGFYRARQNFAPSLSVRPSKDLSFDAGLSFQRLEHQYPSLHTETAYAGTGNIRYSRDLSFLEGYRQVVTATYGVRTATRIFDSDYVYTRHLWTADYELSRGRSALEAHFRGGIIGGTAPLFERFSLGNSTTLRGWNKFDVAPVGGSRMAHGSLEYKYSILNVFYDVGTVWDPGRYSPVRHGLGFGLASGEDFFLSLAFPVRLHNVAPIFMVGWRF